MLQNLAYRPVLKHLIRSYSLCCPPRRPPGSCPCGGAKPPSGAGSNIKPPSCCCCRPCNIPPNPCVPRFHHGENTWRKYKYLTFFVLFPIIAFQTYNCTGHICHHKGECRDFEYMRRRTKKFPWGDGNKTLFHNDEINHLPGECVPPPLDCD